MTRIGPTMVYYSHILYMYIAAVCITYSLKCVTYNRCQPTSRDCHWYVIDPPHFGCWCHVRCSNPQSDPSEQSTKIPACIHR